MGVTVLPEVPDPEDEEHPPALLPEQIEGGPAMLSSAINDADVCAMYSWAPMFSSSSRMLHDHVAGVQSVMWPGASAFTDGKVWSNMYVGWGLKRAGPVPMAAPPAMAEGQVVPHEQTSLALPRREAGPEDDQDA
jgi:radial spoke head protein 4/6